VNATAPKAIPLLVYRDVAQAHDYLVETFGFEPGRIDRSDDGTPMHAEVSIGGTVVWLHRVTPEYGYVSPAESQSETAGVCVEVEDARAQYQHCVTAGADLKSEPQDQPYGYTEFVAVDLDGRRWTFMSPLPE